MAEASRRILLGQISAPHGIRGEVMIASYAASPADIAAYGPLEDETGSRHFELKVVRVTARGVIARIAGVADRTEAEKLKGVKLFVRRDRLPEPAGGEFYRADLVGLTAVDGTGQIVGDVVGIENFGAGDLVEIKPATGGTTELIPFTVAFVPIVDIAGGRIVVNQPQSETDETPEQK